MVKGNSYRLLVILPGDICCNDPRIDEINDIETTYNLIPRSTYEINLPEELIRKGCVALLYFLNDRRTAEAAAISFSHIGNVEITYFKS